MLARSAENQARLAPVIEAENHLFYWFSYLYFRRLRLNEGPSDDELCIARWVIEQLYSFAGRRLPEYFPGKPLEQIYNPDRMLWLDLLEQTKQARLTTAGPKLLVVFDQSMQHHEINEYLTALPQTVKWRRRGNLLTVESPKEFLGFIGQNGKGRGWLNRLLGRH